MEVSDINEGLASRRRKPTPSAIRDRLKIILKIISGSREYVELFSIAEKGIDPRKVQQRYTQSLLYLQRKLNAVSPDKGNELADKINSKVTEFGYMNSLKLVDYIIHNITANSGYLSTLLDQIEEINGSNGVDTKWLRYNFIENTLPGIPTEVGVLEQEIAEYQRNISRQSVDPETEKYRLACQTMFNGDFESMRKHIISRLSSNLEDAVEQMMYIDNAESCDE